MQNIEFRNQTFRAHRVICSSTHLLIPIDPYCSVVLDGFIVIIISIRITVIIVMINVCKALLRRQDVIGPARRYLVGRAQFVQQDRHRPR